MGKRYVIADTHFGHANAIAYCNRPYGSVGEMERALVDNWNETVGKDDVVYMLGDFTLTRNRKEVARLASMLNGKKVLVMGNHDRLKPKDYVDAGFWTAIRKPILVEPDVVLMHEPPKAEDVQQNTIYVHGHVHEKPSQVENLPNCVCVCVERTDYRPVDLDALVSDARKAMRGGSEPDGGGPSDPSQAWGRGGR